MKILSLLLCGAALCMTPLQADDACCATGINVAQKLQEIDLKIQLASYEKIRTAQMEAQLKMMMVKLDTQLTAEERDRQILLARQQVEELYKMAEETRALVLELGKSLQVAAK